MAHNSVVLDRIKEIVLKLFIVKCASHRTNVMGPTSGREANQQGCDQNLNKPLKRHRNSCRRMHHFVMFRMALFDLKVHLNLKKSQIEMV